MKGSRGFSVLEMLVAAALMLFALALASQLVLAAQASIANSGRRQLDMSVDLAFDQLRVDVRNSVSFIIPPGIDDLWVRDEPLRLRGHTSGDNIVYELVNDNLFRVVYKPGELNPSAQRLMLNQVSTFRWHAMPNGSGRTPIRVEVQHRETAPLLKRTAAGQREAEDWVTRTVQMVIAPRQMSDTRPENWW